MLSAAALERWALFGNRKPSLASFNAGYCKVEIVSMRSSLLVSFVFRVLTWFLYPLALLLLYCPLYTHAYEVVFAVNCGGPRHTDRYGIHYKADDNTVGIPSTFGRSLSISRVHPEDMILYQTERYHTSSFSYSVPIEEEGEYILVTKFSEVYFQHSGGKVFDVILNKKHHIISNLDIFSKVGMAAAYDEVTHLTVEDGQLIVDGESSDFRGTLTIEFAKGNYDNPKVNAIVLLKGPLQDAEVPALAPPIPQEDLLNDSDLDEEQVEDHHKFKRPSGPKTTDPYASDDSWFMPITIAVAVFLPVLFFLCRVR